MRLHGTTLMFPVGVTVTSRRRDCDDNPLRHASWTRMGYPYALRRHAKGNKDKAPCLREI